MTNKQETKLTEKQEKIVDLFSDMVKAHIVLEESKGREGLSRLTKELEANGLTEELFDKAVKEVEEIGDAAIEEKLVNDSLRIYVDAAKKLVRLIEED